MQINRNNLAKITIAIAIALGFMGLETKAYASQEVENAKIVGYGCVDGNGICFLTIDKNHPITKYTASCVQKTFAWNSDKNPEIIDLVKKAYNEGILVRLQYSEFNCFRGGSDIPNQFIDLIKIDLKKYSDSHPDEGTAKKLTANRNCRSIHSSESISEGKISATVLKLALFPSL